MAAEGLLENSALAVNSDLTANIISFNDLGAVSAFSAVIANAVGNLANTTLANLQQMGSTDLPAITNVVPQDYMGVFAIGNASVLANSYPQGFTGAVGNRANVIMGNGDLSVFAQIYQTSVTYLNQSNDILSTAQNAGPINATFVDMDSLSTGSLSEVSRDLPAFGRDLENLGYSINLAELDLLGYPSILLRQTISRGNGGITPALRSQLEINGVLDEDILGLITQPTPEIVGNQELAIYRAMQQIRGPDLDQILDILDVTLTDLASMADLLNPVKILPNSYLSLTVPIANSLIFPSIYLQTDTVNDQLGDVFGINGPCQIRNKIMPADQAVAMQALGRALQSIQNVAAVQLPDLAAAAHIMETFDDLPLIQQQSTAVTVGTVSGIRDVIAPIIQAPAVNIQTSTGKGNNFVVYDFVGTAAGYPHATELSNIIACIESMTSSGELDPLLDPTTGAYAAMQSVLAGNLTLDPPWGSGAYANVNVAMDAVISNTNTVIANIAVSSTCTPVLNQGWARMAQQLIREEYNQQLSRVELDELAANSVPTILSLVSQLHSIGNQICDRDGSDFFTAIANITNQGGQAVVASLREGRNIDVLQEVGVGINAMLPQPDPAACGAVNF